MCDGLGRQFSYSCPNTTLFQQRMLICDHWYMVNCSTSEDDYSANLLIGQKEKKFVDDEDPKHPYRRTPRPDLLSRSSAPEFTVYRKGKSFAGTNLNVVGANTDDDDRNNTVTDKPAYFLPSHWSTEYSKQGTTRRPFIETFYRRRQNNNQQAIDSSNRKPFIDTNLSNRRVTTTTTTTTTTTVAPVKATSEDNSVNVNFQSSYKGTTPVFPKVVDFTTPIPPLDELGLLPPADHAESSNVHPKAEEEAPVSVNFESKFKATTPVFPLVVDFTTPIPPLDELGVAPPESENEVPVNFKSIFKNTTPVFPTFVDSTTPSSDDDLLPPKEKEQQQPHEEENIPVNFESNFKGTTPVFPKTVDFTTPLPPGDEIGLKPPSEETQSNTSSFNPQPSLSTEILPPPFDGTLPQRSRTDETESAQQPSLFYQPPKFEPYYRKEFLSDSRPSQQENVKTIQVENNWSELRKAFLIPDYEFPLDTVSRPGYDSVLSSFQAEEGSKRNKK